MMPENIWRIILKFSCLDGSQSYERSTLINYLPDSSSISDFFSQRNIFRLRFVDALERLNEMEDRCLSVVHHMFTNAEVESRNKFIPLTFNSAGHSVCKRKSRTTFFFFFIKLFWPILFDNAHLLIAS